MKTNVNTNQTPEPLQKGFTGLPKPSRRRRQPVVLLHTPGISHSMRIHVFATATQKKWKLLDVAFRRQHLPAADTYQGAIVYGDPDTEIVREMLRLGKPVVRLGRSPNPMDDKIPAIIPDWEKVGQLAAEHFTRRGFKNVGYIGRQPWRDFKVLYHAFQKAAGELGADCRLLKLEARLETSYLQQYNYIRDQILEWLEAAPMPMGLFAFSDRWAAQLVHICSDAGYALPEQISILGVGDDEGVVNVCIPNISSVNLDEGGLAATAVEKLDQMMRGRERGECVVRGTPKGVVARTSTEMLAVRAPEVAAALRFIWEHYDLDLSVDEVAAEVGLPRYKLERLFRRHLDRGVNQELVRKRLEVFSDLLCETDDPIRDLSARCGFRTLAHLNRRFKALTGITPRTYRARSRREIAEA